ncbi:unnamed protein product [Rotaria magnacalcarata]|uniref:VIT domain-containing protein n=1 Tax=Rotaria magnacalcarata TaxID=392030 RepID=A0A8S2QMP1_9BILA|nr:unnamed protein product [Rotaria magnacalcarata]CAF4114812.1 unnamed protein product [Rotaria magnacalcarata]
MTIKYSFLTTQNFAPSTVSPTNRDTGLRLTTNPIYRSTRDGQYSGTCVVLLRTDNWAVVPLRSVSAEAWIYSYAADVTITQVYVNKENHPIEAVYVFPIEVLCKYI